MNSEISRSKEPSGTVEPQVAANLDEALVSGGTESKHGHPDEVRKKNAIHRDSRTRLGKGVPAQPTVE
jgi:hypothetical protein